MCYNWGAYCRVSRDYVRCKTPGRSLRKNSAQLFSTFNRELDDFRISSSIIHTTGGRQETGEHSSGTADPGIRWIHTSNCREIEIKRYVPIDEGRWRGVTQLKTRPDDLLLNGHHPRASRTLVHPSGSYHLIAVVLSLRRAHRHPVTAWLDHRVHDHHCSSPARNVHPAFTGSQVALCFGELIVAFPAAHVHEFVRPRIIARSILWLINDAEGITLRKKIHSVYPTDLSSIKAKGICYNLAVSCKLWEQLRVSQRNVSFRTVDAS